MLRMTIALLVIAALAAPALATPYWVAWEGEDYPENEGWERIIEGDGPADRTLEQGTLTIDSRWSTQISDFYQIDRQLNPSHGERFVAQWRVRINEVAGNVSYDPAVTMFSDDDWGLGFHFHSDGLSGTFEDFFIPFEPGVFHSFELRSADMESYELLLDGLHVRLGGFWEPAVSRSLIAWGDATRGAASSSDWDYFRFGVIPEPSGALAMYILLGTACFRGTRRHVYANAHRESSADGYTLPAHRHGCDNSVEWNRCQCEHR